MKRHRATQDQPIPEIAATRIAHPKHAIKAEAERFRRQPEVHRLVDQHAPPARRSGRNKKVPV